MNNDTGRTEKTIKQGHNVQRGGEMRLIGVVKVLEHVRSNKDHRKFVDRYICEYRDGDNVEYRKAFETPCEQPFTPPSIA